MKCFKCEKKIVKNFRYVKDVSVFNRGRMFFHKKCFSIWLTEPIDLIRAITNNRVISVMNEECQLVIKK